MGEVLKFESADNPRFHYGRGIEGGRYRSVENLDTAEIAKLIRKELKKRHPTCKFSVTIDRFSGGSAIKVYLMAAPFEPFTYLRRDLDRKLVVDDWVREHGELGVHRVEDDERLTPLGKLVMGEAIAITESYNFDDSDPMTDYFHVNFFTHYGIGKWDRPFVNTDEPTAEEIEALADEEMRRLDMKAAEEVAEALADDPYGYDEMRDLGII